MDGIVTLYVPVIVRAHNVDDPVTAQDMARSLYDSHRVHALIEDALDPTIFYIGEPYAVLCDEDIEMVPSDGG